MNVILWNASFIHIDLPLLIFLHSVDLILGDLYVVMNYSNFLLFKLRYILFNILNKQEILFLDVKSQC